LTDQRKAADHRPHLMMEERPRRCEYADPLAVPGHVEPVERTQWAVGLTMRRTEGGEIMPPDQMRRTLGHRGDVERGWNAPRQPLFDGQRRAARADAIFIMAGTA